MNQAEVICRNSPGYWDRSFALGIADKCQQLSGFKFRIFECKYCQKYHLTARGERVKS